jgi:hypothetical protein
MGPVKDFVRDSWKIAAVAATGAFLLSLVVGLFAGNPFGVSFFRALLFALLFAGLGAGVRTVVKGYLPELVAANPQTAGATSAAAGGRAGAASDHRGAEASPSADAPGGLRGAAVDIVLPEDETLRRQAYRGSPRSTRATSSQSTDDDGERGDVQDAESMDEDSTSQAEAQALGELADELADELPGVSENADPDSGGSTSAGSAGEEPVQEAEADDELPRSARELKADLDSLPDIAALEPLSEERPGRGPARATRLVKPGERPQDAVREVLSGEDPATLARALRTVLKKDEKG